MNTAPSLAPVEHRLAQELGVRTGQVQTTISLLDGGATVPFIARYRKEATGGLSDTQLRLLAERLTYLRELDQRREAILTSIAERNLLSEPLKAALLAADTKARLEDLYLPYKPKRRSKATAAHEAGLSPLADRLLLSPDTTPEQAAQGFLNPDQGVPDIPSALEGAAHILVERFCEDAELLQGLRASLWKNSVVTSRLVKGKAEEGAKFSDYFDFEEPIRMMPSHRALACFRGAQEGVLKLKLALTPRDGDPASAQAQYEQRIARHFNIQNRGRAADAWLASVVHQCWKTKLFSHLETDAFNRLKEEAGEEAIRVFAKNLHGLLLAAPAGPLVTLGLDPGIRTGVKVAVADGTGKVLETTTIYPHPPQKQWQASLETLAHLMKRHGVQLISIGNGTGSRETDRLVAEVLKLHPELKAQKRVVSEAGASVYSASALAEAELPGMDVSLRGAVSIARRSQDPLAELVKIEPKAIGVGQYQHDVNQSRLEQALEAVVEDCVNAVGVEVNSASIALLTSVSGLSKGLAKSIVDYRDTHGPFANRTALKKVPRFGEKAFEQAAGFLRIRNGATPLDASAVHPEAYPVVQRILDKHQRTLQEVIGDQAFLRGLNPGDYTDERFGLPTVQDILAELEKPGRDPRPTFKTATLQEGIETLQDLKPGMILEGTITNVTNFGAFVDIGVHQDGLVHISHLADRFIKDPHQVVTTGDVVTVKVLEVDIPRKRVSLSMRMNSEVASAP
jgi:uncharacterized protein